MKLQAFMICLSLALFSIGCKKDEEKIAAPVITINDELQELDGLNVGDEVRVNVNVKSAAGIKRLAYYFINKTANGTASGTPAYIDKTDYPTDLTQEIVFKVQPDFVELVIISFDKLHNSSEVHITPKNIRSAPILAFKDNVKYRASLFENKSLTVEGNITSEFDLSSVSYQTIVNGTASEEKAITISNKRDMNFAATVVVPKNLSAIVIKAKNMYNGAAIDTFKIGTVVDDDVVISLQNNATAIPVLYAGVNNTLAGTVFSGSAVTNLTYAVKLNGAYGAETPMTIGTPNDEFNFSITYPGTKGIEAVRISGRNAGTKTKVAEFVVGKTYNKLLTFTNIKLTSEIGPGKNNWFSAYQAPHVFDATNAAGAQLMVDFALMKYSSTSFRIMPAAVFEAGAAYKTAVAPYMVGFTKAPYTLVTVNRPSITTESFNALEWDGELDDFINNKIKAPVAAGGENYNVSATNRRFNDGMKVGAGFVIGWGQWSPINNQAFGIVFVKEYNVSNGIATCTLEIKVPAEDNRTKYNPVSIFDYQP